MAGLGLTDFMQGLTGGMNAGMQQMSQGFQALMQSRLAQKQHDQQQQDQIAAENRQHDWELQQQAKSDEDRKATEDLQAAEHGLVRVPNGDQDAAKRLVEAHSQVTANPAASTLDSLPSFAFPGTADALAPGNAIQGAPGWLSVAQQGAALQDPANQRALSAVGGTQGALTPSGWEKLRNTAWNGGGDRWEMDPSLLALHAKGNQKGPFDAIQKYDEMARASIANEQPPPQLAQLLTAAQAASQGGNTTLAQAMMDQANQQNLQWEADKESRRKGNFQEFIKRDAAAGVPEALDLAGRYGLGQGGPTQPPTAAPPQPSALPPQHIDDALGAAQAKLAQLTGAGAATAAGASMMAPAAPPMTARPSSPPAMYPVDLLMQGLNRGGPGLPNVTGIASAAQPAVPPGGLSGHGNVSNDVYDSTFSGVPFQHGATTHAPLPAQLATVTPPGVDPRGFNPAMSNESDVQPIVDWLRAHTSQQPVQRPVVMPPPSFAAGGGGAPAAAPAPGPQLPPVPMDDSQRRLLGAGMTTVDTPQALAQNPVASAWEKTLGHPLPIPGTAGGPATFDQSILGLGLTPDEAARAGIEVKPNGEFTMGPQQSPGILDGALAHIKGLFGNGTALAGPPSDPNDDGAWRAYTSTLPAPPKSRDQVLRDEYDAAQKKYGEFNPVKPPPADALDDPFVPGKTKFDEAAIDRMILDGLDRQAGINPGQRVQPLPKKKGKK